jgi:hypothetical protein
VCSTGGTGGGSAGTGGSSGTGGSTGTGGSSGTGGGTQSGTGGGVVVSSNDQELVSGTRLRAINLAGDDGSRAPFSMMFWDNTLNTYCLVSSYPLYFGGTTVFSLGDFRCYPLLLAYPGGLLGTMAYTDPTCTQQAAALGIFSSYQDIFTDAGLPAGNVFYYSPDAGMSVAVPAGSAYLKLDDGGCQAYGDAYTAGSPVPTSSLAKMSIRRE